MDSDYVFLTEKEAMWAEMLMEALQKANIPSTSVPVYGAGLVMRAGCRSGSGSMSPWRINLKRKSCWKNFSPKTRNDLILTKTARTGLGFQFSSSPVYTFPQT